MLICPDVRIAGMRYVLRSYLTEQLDETLNDVSQYFEISCV